MRSHRNAPAWETGANRKSQGVDGDSGQDTPPQQVDPQFLREWVSSWIADDLAQGIKRLQAYTELRKRQRWILLFTHPFSPLGPTEKLVLHTLASFMKADGEPIYRGYSELCEASSLARSTVKRTLASLDAKDWIERVPGCPGRNTVYSICTPLDDPREVGPQGTHMGSQGTHMGSQGTHMGSQGTQGGSTAGPQSVGLSWSDKSKESAGSRPPVGSPSGNGKPDLDAIKSELREIIDGAGSIERRSKRAGMRAGRRGVGRDDAQELVEELVLHHEAFFGGWEGGSHA